VIVLDVGPSMQKKLSGDAAGKSRMEVAKEAIKMLTEQKVLARSD